MKFRILCIGNPINKQTNNYSNKNNNKQKEVILIEKMLEYLI